VILVTGGTGFIGRRLVAQLLSEGRAVRCLLTPARAARLPWDESVRPEIVIGSILNDEALFKAATGAHTVIHLENAQWWGRPRDLERVELDGVRHLVTAARAARVGRIITLSHLGASPAAAYPILRYKGLVEDAIKTSGLAYTIIRSGFAFGEDDAFVNHLAMQMRANPLFFFMPGRGEVVLHPIYVGDLVGALVASLETIEAVDQVIEIGGAEYITLADLLRTVMRVSRAPRAVVGIPPYLLRGLTAFYNRLLPRSLITNQWLDLLATHRTARLGTLFEMFGIRPRRLEDTLLTYMRGRRYTWRMVRYTFRRRPKILE
jgi:NADH dehydrogenase